MHFQDRPYRPIQLRVHRYDVLPVPDRGRRNVSSELDGAGHLHDGIDPFGLAQ